MTLITPDISNSKAAKELKNSGKKVVCLIPRGEVIRNFVYSGTFQKISENAELSLLAVSANSDFDTYLEKNFGQINPLIEYDENWIVRFQREIIDIAHGRWLWSQAAQHRWRQRDIEAVTPKQKAVRLAKKMISFPFSNDLGMKLLIKSERMSSKIFKSTEEYVNLFKKIKPTLVFNGSHIHSRNAIQAVQAAQWLKIPTATFIFSWDNLTSQGRITLPYDYFLVWNEALRNQLLEMYDWIKPENVFVTGTPQFDFHFRPEFYQSREEFCQTIGADPNRPIVLYSTGMANHMPAEPEIVEAIADILNEYDEAERPQLLVRVYPKDLTGRFDELKNRRKDILFPKIAWEAAWLTPKYEDSYALVNTIRHCSLGINVASTISLELCMFDKPTINVGFNPPSVSPNILEYAEYYGFDHYKPIVDSGAVQVAWSREELQNLIKESLINPAKHKNEREKLIEKMFGSMLDGKSGYRVADVLLNLA